jgi:RimJ/RimL family protein N-acetyltransferase
MLQTPRLKLRAVTVADAPRIAALAGVWEVASMTGRIPYPYDEISARQWVTGLAEKDQVFGVDRDGALIGICGFTPHEDASAELGYWIGRPYWGHGFATEAARALIGYGFTKARIRRFVCRHAVDNPASARVIEKLGFRYIGEALSWCEARQTDVPTLEYERYRPWTAAIRALAS